MNYTSENRGYSAIGLDNPKSIENVGGALRAAAIYGSSLVVSSKQRWRKAKTDTMKAYKKLPFISGVEDLHDYIPYDCVPVAIEIIEGAIPLTDFAHPERAFYIFGAEDATLGKRVADYCRHVVYVPTNGCMNLAATVNVVLYDRMLKQSLNNQK